MQAEFDAAAFCLIRRPLELVDRKQTELVTILRFRSRFSQRARGKDQCFARTG
jgi:hypothetical protein